MSGDNVGRNRDGTYQFSYGCPDRCVKAIRKERLESYIMEVIRMYLDDEPTILSAADIVNDFSRSRVSANATELPVLRKRLYEIDAEYEAAINRIQNEGSDAPISVMADIRALKDERLDLRKEIASIELVPIQVDGPDLVKRLRGAWDGKDLPLEERKVLIQRVIKRVVVHENTVDVTLDLGTFGGAEGSRTPVRKPERQGFSERSLCFRFPSR